MKLLLLVLVLALLVWGLKVWTRRQMAQRAAYILGYAFPAGLMQRLQQRRPELSPAQQLLVAKALRQFFLAYLRGGRQFVAMPSQVVDDLWHEFILHTRHYELFCRQAFGRFLHHSPAAVLGDDRQLNRGLRHIWRQCCEMEGLPWRQAATLPLLFALDAQLGVADGFHYQPDCGALRPRPGEQRQCAAGLGCGGGDGGSGDAGCTDGSDGGADGGGDGGGCGGGCGGGD